MLLLPRRSLRGARERWCGEHRSLGLGAGRPPEFLDILTDDQTIDSLGGEDGAAAPPPRHPGSPTTTPSSLLLSLPGQLPDRPVPRQPRRPQQQVSVRLRGDGLQPDAHGARRRRRQDRLDRQAAQRREHGRDRAAPGFDDWLVPLHAEAGSDRPTTRSATTARSAPGPAPTRTASTPPGLGSSWPPRERSLPADAGVHSRMEPVPEHPSPAARPAPPPTAAASPAPPIPSGPTSTAVAAPASRPTATGRRSSSPWNPSIGSSRSSSASSRRSGRLPDTYVIFQSDNGTLHGEHGVFDKNVPGTARSGSPWCSRPRLRRRHATSAT